jgi:hypothetical protein
MLEYLISRGHSSSEVWDYTPRRLVNFYWLASRRGLEERAQALETGALAASGDGKAIEKQTKEWRSI